MSEEGTSTKKEEDFFGIPISKLGGPALAGVGIVGLGLLGLAAYIFKPQIEGRMNEMQARQAYMQQQQMQAAQLQQQQLLAQQQQQQAAYSEGQPQTEQQEMTEQQGPPPQQGGDSRYAIEQDPFSRNSSRRVRIPEYEANEVAGQSRFNNVSV